MIQCSEEEVTRYSMDAFTVQLAQSFEHMLRKRYSLWHLTRVAALTQRYNVSVGSVYCKGPHSAAIRFFLPKGKDECRMTTQAPWRYPNEKRNSIEVRVWCNIPRNRNAGASVRHKVYRSVQKERREFDDSQTQLQVLASSEHFDPNA